MSLRKRLSAADYLVVLVLTVLLVLAVAPFLFMVFTGLKSQSDIYSIAVWQLPEKLKIENYTQVLNGNFFVYLKNSLLVVSVSVLITLIVSSMAAFSLTRVRFKGSVAVLGLIIAGMAIPVHVSIIPIYVLSIKTNTYNHLYALIGPYVAYSIPISTYIISDFMRGVPKEMEEAAMIDGCPIIKVFFKIFMPLTTPAIVTLAIYNAVSLWSEFLFVLVLTQDVAKRTLPLGIWEFKGAHQTNIPLIMAFLTLSSLPLIIVYIFGQDKIIKGMMVGAVKE